MRALILAVLLLLVGSEAQANSYCGYYRIRLNAPTFLEYVVLQGIDPIHGNYGDCLCPELDMPQRIFDDGYGPDSLFKIRWCGDGRSFILTSCD
jgi:hypothetical protein